MRINNLLKDPREQTSGAKKICLTFLVGMLILSSAGCSKNVAKPQSQLEGYPIASDVFTTLQKTVVPDSIPSGSEKVLPYEISKYKQNGYGSWHYGPGIEPVKRLDIMPTTYSGTSATTTAKLLNFFAISDIHISDKETPAQGIYSGYKGGNSSAYSPTMLYTRFFRNERYSLKPTMPRMIHYPMCLH